MVEAAAGDSTSLQQALGGEKFDAVISCIASRSGVAEDAWKVDCEANRNLLHLAQATNAQHFVLLSAICVQRPKLAFQHAKLAFERELERSGLDFSIVRPTAFFKSLSGQLDRVRNGKPFLVFGDGKATRCKPISEHDLASFMVDCLCNPEARNRVLPIGGPGDAITPLQQGELLFEVLGRRPQFRHVPVSIFTVASAILGPLGSVFPAAARKAELARIGRYYATESMLLWDAEQGRYDAEATPATGSITLRDHYRRIVRDGLAGQELKDQKIF